MLNLARASPSDVAERYKRKRAGTRKLARNAEAGYRTGPIVAYSEVGRLVQSAALIGIIGSYCGRPTRGSTPPSRQLYGTWGPDRQGIRRMSATERGLVRSPVNSSRGRSSNGTPS